MIICSCFNVSDEEIKILLKNGINSLEGIIENTFATSGCGCCQEQLEKIVNNLLVPQENIVESANDCSPINDKNII